MKYIKAYEKHDKSMIWDWFKSDCRHYDDMDYWRQNEIDYLVSSMVDKFDISEEEAEKTLRDYYSIPNNLDIPLLMAAYNMDGDVIFEFLDKGADINFQDSDGMTPLMYIAHECNYNGLFDILKRFLEYEPDIYLTNKKGQTFYDFIEAKNNTIVFNQKLKKYIDEKYPEFLAAKKYNL